MLLPEICLKRSVPEKKGRLDGGNACLTFRCFRRNSAAATKTKEIQKQALAPTILCFNGRMKIICQQATIKDVPLMNVSPVNCSIIYIFVLNFNTELAGHIKHSGSLM